MAPVQEKQFFAKTRPTLSSWFKVVDANSRSLNLESEPQRTTGFVLVLPQASQSPRRVFPIFCCLSRFCADVSFCDFRFWRVREILPRWPQDRKVDLVLQRCAANADVGATWRELLLYSQWFQHRGARDPRLDINPNKNKHTLKLRARNAARVIIFAKGRRGRQPSRSPHDKCF